MQSSVATNYKNIGLMGLVFAVAILGVSVMSAHAQAPWYGNNGGYGNGGYYPGNGGYSRVSSNDLRKAYDRGYKQGEKDGKNDAKNHRGSYNRNAGYGTNGNGRWGGVNQIQRAYQDGYQRGYQDGYDRNVRYNRNSRYRYGNRSVFGIPLPY